MKNQYVGDIGDFGKYALLNALSPGLKLGVIWYLTPNNKNKTDGNFIRYLNLDSEKYGPDECERNAEVYQDCDPELYCKLRKIVADNKRSVEEIQQQSVLPANTTYYNCVLTKDDRKQWFDGAVEKVRDSQLVFLDPDNGLSTTNPTSPGHVQLDEVRTLFDRGQSLVVYHHLGRHKKGHEQATDWRERIEDALQRRVDGKIVVLWYHRGTPRFYFIIPQPEYDKLLRTGVESLLRSDWGKRWRQNSDPHFTML